MNLQHFSSAANDRGHSSFYQHGLSVSNEPHTFSFALLESKHCSCLFIICQYVPLQKIVRLALSRELLSSSHSSSLSLSSWVTVALLWPSLLHLSPCQDSSFIYRKAFTQINTATQQLPCTHTQTYTHTQTQARSQILAYDQSRTKHGCSGLACLFDSCLSFCQLFSLNTFLFFLPPYFFDCFPSILTLLYLFVPVRKQWPELEEVVGGRR